LEPDADFENYREEKEGALSKGETARFDLKDGDLVVLCQVCFGWLTYLEPQISHQFEEWSAIKLAWRDWIETHLLDGKTIVVDPGIKQRLFSKYKISPKSIDDEDNKNASQAVRFPKNDVLAPLIPGCIVIQNNV